MPTTCIFSNYDLVDITEVGATAHPIIHKTCEITIIFSNKKSLVNEALSSSNRYFIENGEVTGFWDKTNSIAFFFTQMLYEQPVIRNGRSNDGFHHIALNTCRSLS